MSNIISVGFTGDFCPINRAESALIGNSWAAGFDSIKEKFWANDLNVIDLECPLTRSNSKINKTGPHLKAIPDSVEILKHLNCRLVATANNHFMDYGQEGMLETYKMLRANQITWFGSGESIVEASEVYFHTIKDLKLSFINMTENEWTTTHGDEPGCNPLDFPSALQNIQFAKAKSDFVIVILHGGHEHYNLPSPQMKERFRFMVDAGADAVIGHHTHVISGFEIYKGKPIFYSLGNFFFDWDNRRNDPWNIGLFLSISFEKNKEPTFTFELFRQCDREVGVYLIEGAEKESLLDELKDLNKVIQNDEKLEDHFNEYVAHLSDIMLTRIQPYSGKIASGLYKRKLLPDLLGSKKRRLLLALLQCESHREVLLKTLKKVVR